MIELSSILHQIDECKLCINSLPYLPRPVIRAKKTAKILIIGQAPGMKAHHSGVPWNDKSGDRLRDWMGVESHEFYDSERIAIVPMGFCYPGSKKNGGDNPPRPECAAAWHSKVLEHLKGVTLTLLVGRYAQSYYLDQSKRRTMTDTVRSWRNYVPDIVPTPHPSWRTTQWLKVNPWFEQEVLPELRILIKKHL